MIILHGWVLTVFLNGDNDPSTLLVGGSTVETVSPERAAEILSEFRNQRLAGDFSFKFELEHLPRRGRTTLFAGQIWGTWQHSRPVLRVHLRPVTGDLHAAAVSMLSRNGPTPKIWTMRENPGIEPTGPQEVTGGDLLEPILDGMLYSPFDLQMPFIYWPEYEFEGRGRKKGREALVFRMLPPTEFSSSH